MSCKVGNQTNSQDPQAVNSRVFVGNLNTFQCSKTDVERMFQRYGRIAGISMHKGYAFIQFTNPFDARSACLGEDGRLLWGQTLDVNMVAEPKAHQTGRKRQNIAKTGNDWDYYYDSLKVQLESLYRSYYAQVGFPTPRLVPPMKRARLHVPPAGNSRPPNKTSPPTNKHPNTQLSDLKSYSTPDILICGNCRELFSEIEQLMEHKKTYCKLRFTCKCHMLNGCKSKAPGEEPASLLCSQCKDSFHSAWDLMVHVQAAHMLNIYQLSGVEPMTANPPTNANCTSTSTAPAPAIPAIAFPNKEHFEGKEVCESNGGSWGEGARNGSVGGEGGMEDSHCQTDDLSLAHPRAEISSSCCSNSASLSSSAATNTCPLLVDHRSNPPPGVSLALENTNNNMLPPVAIKDEIVSDGGILLSSPKHNQLTLQHQLNGNATIISSATSATSSYPMEASTQTLQLDNSTMTSNTNFEEHQQRRTLLSSLKADGSMHVPFTNGQAAGV